jgi:hypothetical protein
MFLRTRPVLKDGTLSIKEKVALKDVPDNVVVTPLTNSSAFVGATSTEATSRHVFKLGVIEYARFSFHLSFLAFELFKRIDIDPFIFANYANIKF